MRSLGMHLVLAMSALPTGSTQDKVDRYVVDAICAVMTSSMPGSIRKSSSAPRVCKSEATSWR